MRRGKDAYIEKPTAWTIAADRALRQIAFGRREVETPGLLLLVLDHSEADDCKSAAVTCKVGLGR